MFVCVSVIRGLIWIIAWMWSIWNEKCQRANEKFVASVVDLRRDSPKNEVFGISQFGTHPASKRYLLFSKVHTDLQGSCQSTKIPLMLSKKALTITGVIETGYMILSQ